MPVGGLLLVQCRVPLKIEGEGGGRSGRGSWRRAVGSCLNCVSVCQT